MKKFFVLVLAISSALIVNAQQNANVVFILADDLGYGDVGCYGQKLIETPNIDKLASYGMRFTQYYAGTSVCAPSRSSFMTGQHTGHTPIRGNYEIEPEGQFPLPDSTFTIAEMFKKAGYATGGFGKWGLGYPGSEGVPTKQGFDEFYGYNCQRQSHNYFPDHLWNNDKRIDLLNSVTNQTQYAPDLIQQKTLDFIEANKSQPFFLYLAYTLPHAALQLPAGDSVFEYYKKKFKERPKPIKPWNGAGYEPQAYPHAAYAAMVTKLDNYVGEVMRKLKESGLDKNTLVIFTSDNGPHIEGGNTPGFFNSNGAFRGVKRQLCEGGIREPMIAYWPGVIRKNQTSDFICAAWDFFPTFAQMVNQSLVSDLDGTSILPTLIGKGKQKQHEYLYWEFHEDVGRQAVRIDNWKGVRENVIKDLNEPLQLFNLTNDPGEKNDVASQYPLIVKKIEMIMREAHVENPDFPFAKK
jgi:arylsulfatase A-like enzyme